MDLKPPLDVFDLFKKKKPAQKQLVEQCFATVSSDFEKLKRENVISYVPD